jgi:hypothetical protein
MSRISKEEDSVPTPQSVWRKRVHRTQIPFLALGHELFEAINGAASVPLDDILPERLAIVPE